MIANLIAALGQAVAAAFDWLSAMLNASGALSIIITVIIIFLVYRFLLAPIVGSAGSDTVKPEEDKR